MNRIVYVPAHFVEQGRYEKVEVPTGKSETGMFGIKRPITRTEERFVKTGSSDCDIHAARLADDLSKAVAQLNHDGYEVVTITPITTGRHHAEVLTEFGQGIEGGLGYGYSFTKGLIITARRVANRPL